MAATPRKFELSIDDYEKAINLNKNLNYVMGKFLHSKMIINNWEKFLPQFIKITPFEFRRALIERKQKLIDENIPSRIAGE